MESNYDCMSLLFQTQILSFLQSFCFFLFYKQFLFASTLADSFAMLNAFETDITLPKVERTAKYITSEYSIQRYIWAPIPLIRDP